MTLSAAQRERYGCQLTIPGWGEKTQERLAAASAIVVGAGGLGAPAAAYLAAAGVGRIGIVDAAPVALPSLHRQTLHFTPELDANRAEGAALKLGVLNPEIQAEPYPVRLEAMNARAILTGADVALDCSNAAETRGLVNDACCSEGVPLVAGCVEGLTGFVMSIWPGESACYRCAVPALGEDGLAGGTPGSLGAPAGAVGALQALDALKLVTGVGLALLDRLLLLDGADMTTTIAPVERRPECPGCAEARSAGQSP